MAQQRGSTQVQHHERYSHPENGSYFRDADGEPTGYVHEAAVIPMLRSILSEMSMEELSGYAEAFAKTAGRCGITSVGDLPLYGVRAEPAYRILEDKGKLSVRINFAIDFKEEIDEILRTKEAYSSEDRSDA